MMNKERQAETEVDSEQMPIDIPSAQMPQNPMLAAVLIDGDGQKLHLQDRVYTYEAFTNERVYGTLYKNSEFPNVSDYYVSYDDGEDCAVLDFTTIFKA
jgi:hypothetical protein